MVFLVHCLDTENFEIQSMLNNRKKEKLLVFLNEIEIKKLFRKYLNSTCRPNNIGFYENVANYWIGDIITS